MTLWGAVRLPEQKGQAEPVVVQTRSCVHTWAYYPLEHGGPSKLNVLSLKSP